MRKRLAAVAFALATPWASSALACGTSAVCSDVEASFVGHLIIGGIRVEWNTDSEDSTVDAYQVSRFNCSTPSSCLASVVTLNAAGDCGVIEPYAWADNPPDPDSQWQYRLSVISNGAEVCHVDVQPQ